MTYGRFTPCGSVRVGPRAYLEVAAKRKFFAPMCSQTKWSSLQSLLRYSRWWWWWIRRRQCRWWCHKTWRCDNFSESRGESPPLWAWYSLFG